MLKRDSIDGPEEYCCEVMEWHITYKCDMHPNPFDCGDNLLFYDKQGQQYGIIVHDGGESFVTIGFCPWCGKKVAPASAASVGERRIVIPIEWEEEEESDTEGEAIGK